MKGRTRWTARRIDKVLNAYRRIEDVITELEGIDGRFAHQMPIYRVFLKSRALLMKAIDAEMDKDLMSEVKA